MELHECVKRWDFMKGPPDGDKLLEMLLELEPSSAFWLLMEGGTHVNLFEPDTDNRRVKWRGERVVLSALETDLEVIELRWRDDHLLIERIR